MPGLMVISITKPGDLWLFPAGTVLLITFINNGKEEVR